MKILAGRDFRLTIKHPDGTETVLSEADGVVFGPLCVGNFVESPKDRADLMQVVRATVDLATGRVKARG